MHPARFILRYTRQCTIKKQLIAHLRTRHLSILSMADESKQIGQVRSLSESENQLPASKKPRIEVIDLARVEGSLKKTKRDRKREVKKKKQQDRLPEVCSSEDVLWKDVISVLGRDVVDEAMEQGTDHDSPFPLQHEVILEVMSLGSNGEGIAVSKDSGRPWVVIVPLTLPGEEIRARVYKHARMHSFGDLLEVITSSGLRDNSRVRCKYFGSCGGCQYQMLSYEAQLDLKRDVVVKAYKNYSNIPGSAMPSVLPTVPSPLQYGYRTKLTPHFDSPPKSVRNSRKSPFPEKPDWLHIGFNRVGTQKTMDIEDCPIATPLINDQLLHTRESVAKNIHTYSKGVSLLFRDSLDTGVEINPDTIVDSIDLLSEPFNKHICITDNKAIVRERVGKWIFEYNGGSFFQNNNSVLLPLTQYVQEATFQPSPTSSPLTHLVDAYCGAGLFAIVLSPHFQKVAGIELSQDSIRFATRNARLNQIPSEKISFRSGNAGEIFAAVRDFPANETAILIDPPRKGCDEFFIQQLLDFGPKTVVYVSCNVHTQARDVGRFLEAGNAKSRKRYILESVRGFDLFPQTAHVESVAVLKLL